MAKKMDTTYKIVRDNRPLYTEDALEGYAIGYFYGRSIGTDEPGRKEIEDRFGLHPEINHMNEIWAGFKEGYDRGVSDYCDFDEGVPNTVGLHPYTSQDTFGCTLCGLKPEDHDV